MAMQRDADDLADVEWIAQCARRLRQRWPRAYIATLEETALDLWRDDRLRELTPVEAAEIWLAPITT
ncbi:MAG: hypothetical protein M3Z16_05020 [Pseudomonadota bacterium]|nr:hypothetical protein [Pseudomonadota bacterium]